MSKRVITIEVEDDEVLVALKRPEDEPVGEVVSASCDHATVRWLHQTSSVGGGDPRNSRAWPKVSGVSRDEGHSRALLVFFAAEPTDDEVRAVHDTLAAAPTAKAAPQQEAQEPLTFGGRWLCLVCKSSTRGVHGTLDDMVTPCPEGTASSIGAHGIGSACAIAKAKQGGA